MELRASNGALSSITNLMTSDNGIHWTGTDGYILLPEGNAEPVLKEERTNFGNIGTTVSGGKTILIYKDRRAFSRHAGRDLPYNKDREGRCHNPYLEPDRKRILI